MSPPEPRARVCGVVLAAGLSRRFLQSDPSGRAPIKQLFEIDGETLVHRTARIGLESAISSVLVVVGHQAREVRAAVSDLAVSVVENPNFEDGQSTSVRAALAGIGEAASAALFMPCDQPRLDSQTLTALIEAHLLAFEKIVVPAVGGQRRSPVLIPRTLFGALQEIDGDSGARQLFTRYAHLIDEVEFPSDRPFQDLDSLADH